MRLLCSVTQGGHQKLVTANTAQAPCSACSSAASSFRSAVTSSAPAAASFCAAGLVVFLRTRRWHPEVVLSEQHVVQAHCCEAGDLGVIIRCHLLNDYDDMQLRSDVPTAIASSIMTVLHVGEVHRVEHCTW
jgi:hypothetical protein